MDADTPLDLDAPRFTQAEAVAVSGASQAALVNYLVRGIYRTQEDAAGRVGRGRRGYTAADVIRLAGLVQLTRLGLTPKMASLVADRVMSARIEGCRSQGRVVPADGWNVMVVLAADRVGELSYQILIGRDEENPLEALKKGGNGPASMICLSVDRIYQETVKALVQLVAGKEAATDAVGQN